MSEKIYGESPTDKQAQDLLFEHLIEWGYYEVGSEPIKNDEEDDND